MPRRGRFPNQSERVLDAPMGLVSAWYREAHRTHRRCMGSGTIPVGYGHSAMWDAVGQDFAIHETHENPPFQRVTGAHALRAPAEFLARPTRLRYTPERFLRPHQPPC